ncbi:hypothetical protein [Prochlorococcus marinus]|uniref:Uncharacterized protein n=1 Tax=Prochlorococcus marinus str. PAC1 TaxID=59924 RepID=A0A0A2BZ25_PROMR|nr:hypothetical protein [Prochlorococcus marinus]KGG19346.1 hypothetical protein EV03_1728 [Prochlorococcus marinus str. PAC1]
MEEHEAEAKAYSQSCPHQPDGEAMKGRNHLFFAVAYDSRVLWAQFMVF